MKANYEPWNIDFLSFDTKKNEIDKLKFLIRFAVLAPSSHNSQPWSFSVGQNEIVIQPDMSRALHESDKNLRFCAHRFYRCTPRIEGEKCRTSGKIYSSALYEPNEV
ncbi:MAG: hypothetical protein HYT94_03085 [Parcubacteria group bacterium]|nr:hypothetical protein [Parcubacteria group bacterium]